ncbi:glycosyltransferase [Flaviaesturariibacter terrae]
MNVFVTIGSQEPFPRLLRIIDELAPQFPGLRFVVQTTTGHPFRGRHIEALDFIPPAQFRQYLLDADLVVAHAGIGSILNVLELEKPIIVFPRRAEHRETRDNHQVHTARAFVEQGYLQMAETKEQLEEALTAFSSGDLPGAVRIRQHASDELLGSLEAFIG